MQHTLRSWLVRCEKNKIDLASIVEDIGQSRFRSQTDGQMDRLTWLNQFTTLSTLLKLGYNEPLPFHCGNISHVLDNLIPTNFTHIFQDYFNTAVILLPRQLWKNGSINYMNQAQTDNKTKISKAKKKGNIFYTAYSRCFVICCLKPIIPGNHAPQLVNSRGHNDTIQLLISRKEIKTYSSNSSVSARKT